VLNRRAVSNCVKSLESSIPDTKQRVIALNHCELMREVLHRYGDIDGVRLQDKARFKESQNVSCDLHILLY
jgi:hypothetical protein